MDDSQIKRTLSSLVFWLTAVALTISIVQSMVDIPSWLGVVFAVIIGILGLLGFNSSTPVSDPRDKEGNKLTPEGQ